MISVIYFAFVNLNVEITLKYIGQTNLFVYSGIISILCFVAGLNIAGQKYFSQKDKNDAYKRELERSSISNSENSSRVEVLQAKIKTLEKALQDALNR